MSDWKKNHVSEWLYDVCRALPEVNEAITKEVVRLNPDQPGKALSKLGRKELRVLCHDAITRFGSSLRPIDKSYWHSTAILHEISLREEYIENYVSSAIPYHWPYNGILHPGNTALIIIDMQRDFCELGAYMNLVNPSWRPDETIIPPIKNLLERFRRDAYHVVHTREGHSPDMMDLPMNKYWRSRGKNEYIEPHLDKNPLPGIGDGFVMTSASREFSRVLTRTTPGWEIIPILAPADGESVIDKPTKGAFANTEIEMYLHSRHIQNIVFTGVTTDVCVSTIMREANDRGFECCLCTDGTASALPWLKEAIIESVHLSNGIFGVTATSEEILRGLPEHETDARA